jgi:hypothetical protein
MMDFWFGEWELTWQANDSTTYRGKNDIHSFLDDKVVYENFSITSGPNKGYTGKSWSVFVKKTNEWKQTWVDNQGTYLDFKGKLVGDSVIFYRDMRIRPNVKRQQRMVFFDIQEDSLTWSWQHRDETEKGDFGPWLDDWTIYYTRREDSN